MHLYFKTVRVHAYNDPTWHCLRVCVSVKNHGNAGFITSGLAANSIGNRYCTGHIGLFKKNGPQPNNVVYAEYNHHRRAPFTHIFYFYSDTFLVRLHFAKNWRQPF